MVKKPERYGGEVRTKGGSLLTFEVDQLGTTISLNGCEIAQVSNPDMALLMTHVIALIRRLMAGTRENILELDKTFLVVDDEEESHG